MTIALPTRDGELRLTAGDGDCTGCRKKGGGMVAVEVIAGHAERESQGFVCFCGDCLAEGLAIMLGRRHVQQGGDVRDLAAGASS